MFEICIIPSLFKYSHNIQICVYYIVYSHNIPTIYSYMFVYILYMLYIFPPRSSGKSSGSRGHFGSRSAWRTKSGGVVFVHDFSCFGGASPPRHAAFFPWHHGEVPPEKGIVGRETCFIFFESKVGWYGHFGLF